MTVSLRRFRGKVRVTLPALIDLQGAQHHATCRTRDVGSNAAHYCTCGLAHTKALAGDRSTR